MAKLPTCSACSTLQDPKPAADVTTVLPVRHCLGSAPAALFRVRAPSRITATCGGWGSVPGELGRCPTGTDRCRPLRSGRSWPGCGPGGHELGRLSATHGLPSLGERWLRRLVAPRTGLDPETNRGEGAEDQQENDDPGHRWLPSSSSPCQLGAASTTIPGALVRALAPSVMRVRPVPRWPPWP